MNSNSNPAPGKGRRSEERRKKASSHQNGKGGGSKPPTPKTTPSGGDYPIRRYFTDCNGKVHDAWDYGHKGWPIGKSGGRK